MTDPLSPLRDRFRARARADRIELESLAKGDLTSDALRRLVHNLAGTAGTFGFAPLSQAAIEVDDQMASGLPADPASLDRLKARLDEAGAPPA
jgi:HPt (histidine-containing phosphotransfer) domain-containing protein